MKFEDKYDRIDKEDPVSASVCIDEIFSRLKINVKDPKIQLAGQFNSIIGEQYSFATFAGLDNGTVYVECKHPAQVSLVKLTQSELLKKLQSVFPELNIKKILIRVK